MAPTPSAQRKPGQGGTAYTGKNNPRFIQLQALGKQTHSEPPQPTPQALTATGICRATGIGLLHNVLIHAAATSLHCHPASSIME